MTTLAEAFQVAVQHHRAHRLDQAEAVYREILTVQPDQVEVLYSLGVLARQKSNDTEAEKLFQAVLQVEPESFKAWFSLGNLYQGQGQWAAAVSAYQRAVEIRPQEAAIYNNLGYALQQQNKLDEAVACYQTALEIAPDCTEADVNWGNALHAQGKLSQNQQLHYAQLNCQLGVAHEQAGDWQTAQVYYQQAIALQPDLAIAHERLENPLTAQTSLLSFDIFDTLITRFCVDPDEIFLQVECLTNFENFTHYRKQAEHYFLRNVENYDLDDIYLRLAQELNLNRQDIEYLKDAEIAAELQNVIGIKENLDKVRDGDLLVSDMYLPEDVLRKMLQKAGLEKPVNLYVTAKGKHNGTAWREITNGMRIAQHLGDNPHSDVQMAQRYGIRANLYQGSQLSPVESALHEIGAQNLARVIRKIRLGNHFKEPLKQDFYHCFVQGNLVILVIFSVFLLRMAERNQIEKYLFSSRDCYHLHKIFCQIAKNSEFAVDGEYFFTSRLARVKCSEDYVNYLLHLVKNKKNSAIVDLVGTGLSLSHMLKKIDQDLSLSIVFFHHTYLNRVKKIYLDNELHSAIFSLISPGRLNLNIDTLETLNYINQPMVRDVLKQGENEYVPVFYSHRIPSEISNIIDCAEQIIDDFSHHLNPEIVEEIIHCVDEEDFTRLSIAIYQQLSQHDQLLSYLMSFHAEENQGIEDELSARLADGG